MTLPTKKESLSTFRSRFSNLFDFDRFDRLFERDWLFDRMAPFFSEVPAVNIKEDEKMFSLELAAPGMSKKDFHINVDDGNLIISCEKEEETKEEKDNYTRREYSYNNFRRTFALPENVLADNIEAKYDNGLLKLFVPKMEEVKKPVKEIRIG